MTIIPSLAELSRGELDTGLAVIMALTETIRERKEVIATDLYLGVMDRCTLAGFEKVLGVLTRAGLVRVERDVVRWVGPII